MSTEPDHSDVSAAPAVDISVVMSVYNDATGLAATIESVLAQQGPSIEFLIVDDGSTDSSAEIIASYAERDSRVRLIAQQNTGLTIALGRACAQARGEFIARQDAVDISLPGRFEAQLALLQRQPDCVMTAVGARFITTDGLPLFDVIHANPEAENGLKKAFNSLSWKDSFSPPHHGAVMFRREDYLAVGGYNAAFRVAQDFDLWLRLLQRGRYQALPEIYYQAVFDPASISGSRHELQMQTKALICAAAQARAAGESEAGCLQQAQALPKKIQGSKKGVAAGHYLLACRLMAQYPVRARKELLMTLRLAPGHWKAWLRLLQTLRPRQSN